MNQRQQLGFPVVFVFCFVVLVTGSVIALSHVVLSTNEFLPSDPCHNVIASGSYQPASIQQPGGGAVASRHSLC